MPAKLNVVSDDSQIEKLLADAGVLLENGSFFEALDIDGCAIVLANNDHLVVAAC